MKSVAIIGAGIAGITLGKQLQGYAEVSLFEKSLGFGGRMSTRRSSSYQFDHGAQFFTARSKKFQSFVNEHLSKKNIHSWQARILTLDPSNKPYKREWFEPHYIAAPGMNSLCKALAAELNVTLNTQVTDCLSSDRGWLLSDSSGEQLGEFDWVITALPAPQAEALLPNRFAHTRQLGKVDFSPCFSLMLGFEAAPALGFDACIVRNSPLGWIAVNSSKQGRPPTPSIVVHSDNDWARTQIENDLNDVQQEMMNRLQDVLPDKIPSPEHIAFHRWKYAKAETSLEESYLLDAGNRIAACGDWCGGNRVEDAYLSAVKLSEQLQLLLRSET